MANSFTKNFILVGLISAVLITFTSYKWQLDIKELLIRKHNREKFDNSSEKLVKDTRVLCWVLTFPGNHKKVAIHIKNTWGKRCDTLFFASSKNDSELPAVDLTKGREGRHTLWKKTQEAFKLIHKSYLNAADWFLKADDNTYIIMENLKLLLKDYDPNESLIFGQRFEQSAGQSYMGGGAGYVLSKEAVKRFVQQALRGNTTTCRTHIDSPAEDLYIAECLRNVGVKFVDTRDLLGRERFNQFSFNSLYNGKLPVWYPKYAYFYQPSSHSQLGINCCSVDVISFHYTQPSEMHLIEFFIYHLRRTYSA